MPAVAWEPQERKGRAILTAWTLGSVRTLIAQAERGRSPSLFDASGVNILVDHHDGLYNLIHKTLRPLLVDNAVEPLMLNRTSGSEETHLGARRRRKNRGDANTYAILRTLRRIMSVKLLNIFDIFWFNNHHNQAIYCIWLVFESIANTRYIPCYEAERDAAALQGEWSNLLYHDMEASK